MQRIIENIKTMNGWHRAFIVLLAVLFLFLAVRASDEYRWSDWGFGDAQTMLSLRQWEEGGWLRNYFLFKPQGYAKAVDLLDDPELRHHAHGTCPGSSPRVGPRLLYTHYPAGYLVPYAVLFKIGLDSLFAVRFLSILFSLGALALMYALFAKITSPRVSFVAVLFYGLSSPFLGYADSLANQPLDDLLRFGFMLAVVMATRSGDPQRERRWMTAAWVMEFVLSLTSFDSVFFLYAWLIGWDLLEKRGFRWKTYLLFALAPVTAHGLQFLQNVWYLGWSDAFIDIKDAFLLKHGADTEYNVGQGRLGVILLSVFVVFQNLLSPEWPLLVVLIVYLLYRKLLAGNDRELPSGSLLGVLFLCGLAFVLVLPNAARMPYEARQMVPFACLLVSGFTWSFVRTFRASVHGGAGLSGEMEQPFRRTSIAYLVVSAGLMLVLWFGFAVQGRKPVYDITRIMPEVRFAEMLRTMPTEHEPVFFDIGGFWTFWDPKYVPGYPQIMPITEYYTGSRPVLCFDAPSSIADDIAVMVRKSGEPFSPVVIARDPESLREIVRLLVEKGTITGWPTSVYGVMDRTVADLSNVVSWQEGRKAR